VGPGRLKAVVADAGPLIHLTEIGYLPLMSVFEALHIPDAVWRETVGQGLVLPGDIFGLHTVHRHTISPSEVTRFVQKIGFESLHDGERECLYLCQQIGVSTLLTDDLAVREAAKSLNLTPVGSLGIVVRAYRLGKISLAEAEHCLNALCDVSSLFVTRAIVELAIEQLHHHPN